MPDSGFAFSWFDDVGLVEWDSLKEISQYPISISHPNDYEYVQLFFNEPTITFLELIYLEYKLE